jgi:hypothetical protein
MLRSIAFMPCIIYHLVNGVKRKIGVRLIESVVIAVIISSPVIGACDKGEGGACRAAAAVACRARDAPA